MIVLAQQARADHPNAYLRLVTTFLTEYAEDWSVARAYLSEECARTLLPQAA